MTTEHYYETDILPDGTIEALMNALRGAEVEVADDGAARDWLMARGLELQLEAAGRVIDIENELRAI